MPMTLGGKRLFVNADAREGEVRAEILDARGRSVLAGYSLENCEPMRGDRLDGELRWKGAADLSGATNSPVRIASF